MNLFFHTLGQGPPLLILHGLFGSADNWQSLAKNYAEEFQVYLVDLRNHGRSPHSPDHNYELMAQDIYHLVANEGLRDIRLIGHSMGGKAILKFAQQYGFLIEKMLVADMGVKEYPPHHDLIFNGLFEVDIENCPSRKEAGERLSRYVTDPDTQQFLLKNVYWDENQKLAWRFNLKALFNNRNELMNAIDGDIIHSGVHFLQGGKSNYILDSDRLDIVKLIPDATFEVIEGAGHWLHAESPQLFLEKSLRFLRD